MQFLSFIAGKLNPNESYLIRVVTSGVPQGSVLRPILLVSDLDTKTRYILMKFENDSKVGVFQYKRRQD